MEIKTYMTKEEEQIVRDALKIITKVRNDLGNKGDKYLYHQRDCELAEKYVQYFLYSCQGLQCDD